MSKRKRDHPTFKTRVASEALQGKWTVGASAGLFGVNPTKIHQWKRALGLGPHADLSEAQDQPRRVTGPIAACCTVCA